LSHTWVDHKINYDCWRNCIRELQADWAAYVIPSTVILAANGAFLAVQSVDQGDVAATGRTMVRMVSYLSALLNVGRVVASLILAEQHRLSTHRYAEDAVAYLCARAPSKGGVERLAVRFSISAAFFRWG
ncbi:hypothetical protein LXA43DRAFT_907222, partial [Ganoderma leucocontextum]